MKKITKALLGMAAAGALALSMAAPASAAGTGNLLEDGRYVQSYETNTVKLSVQSGCTNHDNAPYHGVWARFDGPSNRDVRITLESVQGGGKGWAGHANKHVHFEKGAYGSTGYVSFAAYKPNGTPYQTRPGATLTFSQQRINEDGTGDGPKYMHTIELPKINCVSVGGAVVNG